MPPPIRRKSTSIIEVLQDDPSQVSFFQAVRLLERSAVYNSKAPVAGDDAVKINHQAVAQFTPPSTELIRFSAQVTLGYPGSELIKVERQQVESNTGPRSRWNVVICFLGLTGSMGVLPFHYTEMVFQRLKLRDHSLKTFLDMFHHRTVSLFYQAGVKYRLPISYERQRLTRTRANKVDNHTHVLLSLIGLGTDHMLEQLDAPYESKVFFSGLLSQRVRPASSIRQMISHYFDVPVVIDEFIGEWHELIPDVRSRFPTRQNPKGQNSCLGRSAILGGKGWLAQGKMRVVLGPLNDKQYEQFAPGKPTLEHLNEMVQSYTGSEVECDYVLKIDREHIPNRIQLNQKSPPTIGWNTWLATKQQSTNDETLDIVVSSGRLS